MKNMFSSIYCVCGYNLCTICNDYYILVAESPDDRNLLNENLYSPDRPKFKVVRHPGKL